MHENSDINIPGDWHMLGHIWWILTVLFCILVIIMGFEGYIWIAVVATMVLIGHLISYLYRFARKPMVSAKGKVQSKVEWVSEKGSKSYHANILLSSKKAILLEFSKEQYDIIKENDNVDLVYQGHVCVTVKGPANHSPILNTTHYPAKEKNLS